MKSTTDSLAISSTPAAAAASASAPTMAPFGTMWAKGSPSPTEPEKVRNTGRTASRSLLSVTIISVIGWLVAAIFSQMPSCSSMRFAAAAMAEARPSREPAPAGAGSTTATESDGAPCFRASAVHRPT